MAKFTNGNIRGIHEEFRKMCEEFAEKHGIKLVDSKLSYGSEELKFTIDMRSEEIGNREFEEFANASEQLTNHRIKQGDIITQGRSSYKITGGVNPRNSKYKIEAINLSKNEKTYFTFDGILSAIRGGLIK